MNDAIPLNPQQKLLNSILNLCFLHMETEADVTLAQVMEVLSEAPKAYVNRVQEEWSEDALIHTPIPPRSGQWNDEDLAMPA